MNIIADIWASFRSMPLWVQFWVALILVPVNSAAIFFVGGTGGWLIAALAIGGMVPNLVLMIVERGLSKAMALSHVALWTPMIAVIVIWLLADPQVQGGYRLFLWLLLSVDLISLGFDYTDSFRWLRGDRAVAGKTG